MIKRFIFPTHSMVEWYNKINADNVSIMLLHFTDNIILNEDKYYLNYF